MIHLKVEKSDRKRTFVCDCQHQLMRVHAVRSHESPCSIGLLMFVVLVILSVHNDCHFTDYYYQRNGCTMYEPTNKQQQNTQRLILFDSWQRTNQGQIYVKLFVFAQTHTERDATNIHEFGWVFFSKNWITVFSNNLREIHSLIKCIICKPPPELTMNILHWTLNKILSSSQMSFDTSADSVG